MSAESGLGYRPSGPRAWTDDVGALLTYAQMVDPHPWGSLISEDPAGVRVLDMEAGLVTLIGPEARARWRTRTWRVCDTPPLAPGGGPGRWLSAGHLPALYRSMWRVAAAEAIATFELAAEVVLAERAEQPDVVLLVGPTGLNAGDPFGGPIPIGVPSGLVGAGVVLSRIVGLTRAAAG